MFSRLIDILFSLNRVHAADWSRLHLRFAFPYMGWMVLLALAAAGFGYWSYRVQSAPRGKRIAMGLLRAAVLGIVVLLFCKPMLVLDQDLKTPSVVAVWVDNSLSMTLRDPYTDPAMRSLMQKVSPQVKAPADAPRPSRWELAVATLQQAKANWLHQLAEKQDVAILTGAGHAQLLGIAHKPEELDGLLNQLLATQPTGEITDVPTVVSDTFRLLQGQPVSSLVLLTDGRSTETTQLEAATSLARQNVAALFALPLGQAHEPLNLAIESLNLPENTFVQDPVAVKAKVHLTGTDKPTTVRVRLLTRGEKGQAERELASREVTLDPTKKTEDVELVFKPTKAERLNLLVKAESIGDELTLADNSATGVTTVLDATVAVLYVEGTPRYEYRFLKNELIREKTIDVSCLLLSADDAFAQEGDPKTDKFPGPITRFPDTEEEMRRYDVLIIGDVDPQFFSPTQQKLIVDFVAKQGGGLMMLAGRSFAPDAYKGTPLEPLLPIVPDDPNTPVAGRSDNTAFLLQATPAGMDSNLFRFFDSPEENERVLKNLPALFWYKPVVGLKGTAEVLAVHPTRTMAGSPAPLLVAGRYGSGRVLFSAVADTWRWRYYTGEPLYQSYWLQAARFLYRNKALGQNRRIELAAESRHVELGQPVRLSARVMDPTLHLPGQITLQVADGGGRVMEPVTLSRVGEEGVYQGLMTAGQIGTFVLQPAPGSLPVDVPPLEIDVRLPERELSNPTADLDALGSLAAASSGKVLPLPEAEQLASLVPDRSVQTVLTQAEELWNKPIALVLIVALLAAEWLVRKSAGLV